MDRESKTRRRQLTVKKRSENGRSIRRRLENLMANARESGRISEKNERNQGKADAGTSNIMLKSHSGLVNGW